MSTDAAIDPFPGMAEVMILLPAAFLLTHSAANDVAAIAFLEMSIAVGSICFHASLRYSMQLLDELPMLWYVLVCTVSFLRRLRGWRSLELPAAAVALTLTTGILLTEQHSTVHEVFRGLMSCTFSVCLV
ncbi:unnamed protein product, partial [Polarella glacialis]